MCAAELRTICGPKTARRRWARLSRSSSSCALRVSSVARSLMARKLEKFFRSVRSTTRSKRRWRRTASHQIASRSAPSSRPRSSDHGARGHRADLPGLMDQSRSTGRRSWPRIRLKKGRLIMARAIRLDRIGGPEVLRLEQVEVGDPGPGEARVRHSYVAVNFIDVYHRIGRYPLPLPSGLGSDAVGVVEAVGSGVNDIKVGDRVG